MSVDLLNDSASTRSQQRGGFKGKGYKQSIYVYISMELTTSNKPYD
ncbi:hypothetical protein [Candidatus Regiella insecticola]|nr:hypothetical protein [Candidatus Regiella insecticola]